MHWVEKIVFDKKRGEIDISEQRHVLVDPNAFRAMRESISEIMKKESADSVIYMTGKKHTQEFVKEILAKKTLAGLISKFGWGREKIIEKVLEIFSQYGYGLAEVEKLDFEKETVVTVKNSCIAKTYKKRQKDTVCSYLAGLIAGGAEAITKTNYDCFETHCIAKGDSLCRFVVEKQKF